MGWRYRISTHAPAGGATFQKCRRIQTRRYFYSRPCGRGDGLGQHFDSVGIDFYSRPCGRGDGQLRGGADILLRISTHAPAGGATGAISKTIDGLTQFLLTPLREGRRLRRSRPATPRLFLLTPLREGRRSRPPAGRGGSYFYSRPCGRGDRSTAPRRSPGRYFYSRPCGRGDPVAFFEVCIPFNFYSRPCGRGDRECRSYARGHSPISTHAPAGGATIWQTYKSGYCNDFYSRPCGRGDWMGAAGKKADWNFYSRPCGRGDFEALRDKVAERIFLLTPLREGRQRSPTPKRLSSRRFLLTPLREGRQTEEYRI